MSYAILRTAKLKTMGNIGASLSHTYRTRDTKNADPTRANQNRFQHKTADDVIAGINARLPAKRRKDAVLAIEYLVASSPDHFKTEAQHMAYLKDAWEWLKDRHGAENVVSAAIHMDEKTPHLVAYVVPIDGAGKLNAKAFLGGRQVLSQMQTDFAKQVGQKHGLERGIERSTATHTSVKEWYGLLNQSMKPVEVPPAAVVPKVKKKRAMLADIVETPEEVAARLNRTIARITEPVMASAKLARQERKTATELRDQVADMQRRLQAAEDLARQVEAESKPLREVYEALTPAEQKNMVQQAKRNLKIRERCEKILSNAYDRVTGPVGRFVGRAKQALQAVKGRWWDADWAGLEKGFVAEERPQSGAYEAMRTVLDHSPGQANVGKVERERLLHQAKNADELQAAVRERQHAAPQVESAASAAPAWQRPRTRG